MPEYLTPSTPSGEGSEKIESPWHFPKPNQNAFNSVGKVTKKHDSIHERLSLPMNINTPGTPKSNRSKFVLPSTLSPFPLSPNVIQSSSRNVPKLSASFHASSTPLRQGYSSDQLVFETDIIGKSSKSPSRMHWDRSASPFAMGSTLKDSDMFDLSSTLEHDYEEDEEEEESSEIAKADMDCDEPLFGSCDVSPEMLKPFPWRTPNVNFLTMEYFSQNPSQCSVRNPDCPGYDFESNEDYFSFRFEIIEAFGVGSFSNVFKVSDKIDHKQYAIKRSKKPFSGLVDRYHTDKGCLCKHCF